MTRRVAALVALVLMASTTGACGSAATATGPGAPGPTTTTAPSPTTASTTAPDTRVAPVAPVGSIEQPVPIGAVPDRAVPPSPPTVVTIPAIGVRSGLERLGVDATGMLLAPVDDALAGWYAAGPQPGQAGPAVIAGHLDSSTGPAVFARLGELRIGDPVTVEREDGSVLTFTVTGRQQTPKDAFPTARVYGPVPRPELRLITCGGEFDRGTGHYRDNVIVFAALT